MSEEAVRARLLVVDAFTSRKHPELKGNPAGVLILSRQIADDTAIATAK